MQLLELTGEASGVLLGEASGVVLGAASGVMLGAVVAVGDDAVGADEGTEA